MSNAVKDQTVRISRLATNYVILSGAELVSKVLAAIAFAYLARVLGPQNYGHLEFVLAVIFFFTLVVDSGLSSYGAREIAKDGDAAPRLIAHITAARVVLAVSASVLLAFLATVVRQPPTVKSLLLLYSLTLFGLPGLIQWVFQGRDLMHYVAIASVIRWSTFSAGVFILIRSSAQLWIVPFVEVAAILGAAAFLVAALLRTEGLQLQRLDLRYALSVFRGAVPIGASELVWAVKVYFATILLGFVIGGSELGWFGAAHRIVISLHAFVWLYFYNLLPSIARDSQKPVTSLQTLMRTSIQLTAWSAVFFGIVGTALAEPAITLLYGSQYRQAATAFQILVWLIPLALMSGHYRYILIGYDKQALEFLTAAFGAAVSVIVNILLIPRFGLFGAAWSLIISEATILIFVYVLVRRTVTHIPITPHLQRPLLAGAVLIALLYILPPINMWAAAGVAIAVYGLTLVVLQRNAVFSTLKAIQIRGQRL